MQKPRVPALENVPVQFFLVRLGKIFFNLSVLFLVLSFCGVLSFFLTAFTFLIGVLVTIVTLGTVFSFAPDFWSNLLSGTAFFADLANFFLQYRLVFAGVSVAAAVAAIVLLSLDRREKHAARTVFAAIFIVLSLIGIFASGGVS